MILYYLVYIKKSVASIKLFLHAFQVERFTQDTTLVCNNWHITQKSNDDIEMSTEEYLGTISRLDISRGGSKRYDQYATIEEITNLLGLTES